MVGKKADTFPFQAHRSIAATFLRHDLLRLADFSYNLYPNLIITRPPMINAPAKTQ